MRLSSLTAPPRGYAVYVEDGAVTYRAGAVRRGPLAGAPEGERRGAREVPFVDPAEESSATALVVDLDRAFRRREVAPWVPLGAVLVVYTALMVALGLGLGAGGVLLVVGASVLASAAVYLGALQFDRGRGTAYLVYSLDDEAAARFMRLQRGIRRIAGCRRVWHVPPDGRAAEPHRRYGARRVLRKYRIRPALAAPPRVRSNVAVPTLYGEGRKYYFFPDRVLAYDARGVHSLPYQLLAMRAGESLCVEDEDVPPDAEVVDTAWLHATPDGGPDPRFPSNRRYPVALYGDLEFAGPAGVRELFQCSRPEALEEFVNAVEAIASGEEWVPEDAAEGEAPEEEAGEARGAEEPDDELYDEALRAVVRENAASLDLLASALDVDFGRAARLLAAMERDGFVGPPAEGRARQVNRSARRYVEAAFGREGAERPGAGREGRARGERGAPKGRSSRRSARRGPTRGARRAPHDVLGVRENATPEEVSAAYHELAQMYHPDKVASLAPEFQEIAERRMKEINEAYRAMRASAR